MRKSTIVSLTLLIGVLTLPLVAFAAAWPNLSDSGKISIEVAGNYEPSGLAWNSVTNKLFTVSDDGKVTMITLDDEGHAIGQETSVPRSAGIGTDFEAITIANPNSNMAYIGIEQPDSIVEYDSRTKQLTGKKWDLTDVLTGADNSGLEGLAFVPNNYLPQAERSASGGRFYAAIQRSPVLNDGVTYNDYLIYSFDIDLNVGGKISRADTSKWKGINVVAPPNTPNTPTPPTSDVSDLSFNQDTGVLYALYDGENRLIEMKIDGSVLNDYSNVPVADQEGVAIVTSYPSRTANIYLASDTAKMIGKFSGYPVTYYDADRDGVDYRTDCNDNDATVSQKQTYYVDADGDGLGADVTAAFCASVPPEGFVTNSDDLNDNDPNNIPTAAPAPVAAIMVSEQNLVPDGDMEAVDTSFWRNYGTPTTVEKVLDTTRTLHLMTNGGGGMQQTNIPVIAGHTYELSYEAKVVSGAPLYVRLGDNDSNADFQSAQQAVGISQSYIVKSRRFVAPASRNFRLVMTVRAASDVYIDNVSIVEVDPINLLTDGNMSALTDDLWNKYGIQSKEKLWDAEKNGRTLRLFSAGSGAQQNYVPVEAGKKYRLTFDYKTSVAGAFRTILSTRKVEIDYEGKVVSLRSEQGWSTYTREFIVPANFVSGVTRFTLNFISQTGDSYIDNVRIVNVVN